MRNYIISDSSHFPAAIDCTTSSTPDTIPHNTSIMENNTRKLHIFKSMPIWATKANLLGVDIWQFFYLIIVQHLFVLPDVGEGCAAQWKKKLKKNKNPLSLITYCVIPNFFSIFSSWHPCLLLGNSLSCTTTHEEGSSSEIFFLTTSLSSHCGFSFLYVRCIHTFNVTQQNLLPYLARIHVDFFLPNDLVVSEYFG